MPWTPTLSVPLPRKMALNILAYVSTNQVDALDWAAPSTLKPIVHFANNTINRVNPVFPSMALVDDNAATEFTDGDLDAVGYRATFEVTIQNADPTVATSEAGYYEAAISSMIRNIPEATLISGANMKSAKLATLEIGYDEIRTNELENDFVQIFQVRPTFVCRALTVV